MPYPFRAESPECCSMLTAPRLGLCREQLATLAKILERADPVLSHHLRQIRAGDCFFAYRMVIVQLRREMPLQQVSFACLPA